MSRDQERLDAAEYVIGTMTPAEHAAFEMLATSSEEVREDIAFWERTFGTLNSSVAPVIPSAGVWQAIESKLGDRGQSEKAETNAVETGSAGPASTSGGPSKVSQISEATRERTRAAVIANDNHIKMTKSRSRWRLAAIAAGLAALFFGANVLTERFAAKPEQEQQIALGGEEYIAVVNANADQPALIVKVNGKTGDVTVRSLGMDRPEGKSLELWYVPEGKDAVSVGLVGEGDIDLGEITAKNGDLLAISLEPQGGSPTGVATGPVIYTGKLIKDVNE